MVNTEDLVTTLKVVKRNGKKVDFDGTKIALAIKKGFDSVNKIFDDENDNKPYTEKDIQKVYQSVINKITDYYTKYTANAHRGDYDISLKVDNEYEGSRDIVKEFINAKTRKEIIFTSGTTESLNIIANGFFKEMLEPGDEIIISESEHASNILPWFNLAKTNGIIIKYCPLDDNHYVTLDNLKKVITKILILKQQQQ